MEIEAEAPRNENLQRITVLLADDHRLFSEALEALLEGDARIEVVGRARNGREAVDLAVSLAPDVVLMDVNMPVMNGLQATERIRAAAPGIRVLMLTGSKSPNDADRALRAGASGYVTKDRVASQLIDAIIELGR